MKMGRGGLRVSYFVHRIGQNFSDFLPAKNDMRVNRYELIRLSIFFFVISCNFLLVSYCILRIGDSVNSSWDKHVLCTGTEHTSCCGLIIEY